MSLFTEVFNQLPLAACIQKKVLVVHGGLFDRVSERPSTRTLPTRAASPCCVSALGFSDPGSLHLSTLDHSPHSPFRISNAKERAVCALF